MTIQLYTYQTDNTNYQQYNGRTCIILRPLTEKEAFLDETGPMFKISFEDYRAGYGSEREIIDAFVNELIKHN